MATQIIVSQTNEDYTSEINNERKLKNQQMSNQQTSPLTPSELENFTSLDYYPVDSKYIFEGQLNASDTQETVNLDATNGSTLELSRYGTVTFTFERNQYTLTLYRNNNLPEFTDKPDQLFIPFSDLTTGVETNDNGRYLAVNLVQGSNTVTLDFNKAFNPYSAYNTQYVSVLPPSHNNLSFSIVSGERKYEHREK